MGDNSRALTKAGMNITEGLPLKTTGDVQKDLQRMMDIEAIKQIKNAYFRCIDTCNLEELETILHPDVKVHLVGGNYEWDLQGRDQYLANIKASFHREAIGHHNGHMPEIQMLSETEATGIWYLSDNMWHLNHKHFTTGTALYWDRYLKVGDHWTIKETNYERVYEINQILDVNPELGSHYLGVHGPEVTA